jgi:hypothetical protein
MSKPATRTAPDRSGVPDIAWIRKYVDIGDVAKKIGLEVSGKMMRCWRPNNHQHGDRTASVGLDTRRNKAKCFVCDQRQISNVDLVMQVCGCDIREAVAWFVRNFDVPHLAKGTHLEKREGWHPAYRAGIREDPLTYLIRTGTFAELKPAAQSVLCVLLEFAVENNECVISYRGLARYSGIQSDATVRAALKQLEETHILKFLPSDPRNGLRGVGRYLLTPDSQELAKSARATYERLEAEISLEKELRQELRQKARQKVRDQFHTSKNEEITLKPEAVRAGILPSILSSKSEDETKKTLQKLTHEFAPEPVEAAIEVDDRLSRIASPNSCRSISEIAARSGGK